jgi:glycosyltransferase involved in cell wall biosynthesis
MQAIDLFTLPSHREGMPRSIIEAMASGKPVVATDIRGCREEVVHDLTGLIVPLRDRQALAQAMTLILSDSGLARRMGSQGRQRAEDLYNERDVLDREIQVYRNLTK